MEGTGEFLINDIGVETELIYKKDVDLPCFAAFALLKTDEGRDLLVSLEEECLNLAKKHNLPGYVTWTRTWRSNPEWAAKLDIRGQELDGYNRKAAETAVAFRKRHETEDFAVYVCSMMGPRCDGYVVRDGDRMTAEEAEKYHYNQVKVLSDGGVDYVMFACTTYSDEAIGVVRAAKKIGVPVAVSFTTEVDGTLPGGETLKEAVTRIDELTELAPIHYGVNCAHATHFMDKLDGKEEWMRRIGELKPNPSPKSHAELNNSTTLQRGDPAEFGRLVGRLRKALPGLKVFGGCCGTDVEHLECAVKELLKSTV